MNRLWNRTFLYVSILLNSHSRVKHAVVNCASHVPEILSVLRTHCFIACDNQQHSTLTLGPS